MLLFFHCCGRQAIITVTGEAVDDDPRHREEYLWDVKLLDPKLSRDGNYFKYVMESINKMFESTRVAIVGEACPAFSSNLKPILDASRRGLVSVTCKIEWTDPKTVCIRSSLLSG